jgi:hypothetical protein
VLSSQYLISALLPEFASRADISLEYVASELARKNNFVELIPMEDKIYNSLLVDFSVAVS